MTALLTYEIIMTLPEMEKNVLFDMLEPQIKYFDLEDLLQDDGLKLNSKEEIFKFLIKTVFSKNKKS
jgi:urate oxidase